MNTLTYNDLLTYNAHRLTYNAHRLTYNAHRLTYIRKKSVSKSGKWKCLIRVLEMLDKDAVWGLEWNTLRELTGGSSHSGSSQCPESNEQLCSIHAVLKVRSSYVQST